MIQTNGLNKHVMVDGRQIKLLDNICLSVNEGDFIMVTGRSGSGKTTLLHTLSTLTSADSGEIIYQGQDLCQLSGSELNSLRQSDFSIIFQFHHLFPYLNTLENCLLPFMGSIKPISKEIMEWAKTCLQRVGLHGKEQMLPAKLSGGEQQRVAIARALIKSSKILFADEPTGSLDKKTGEQIMELLLSLHREGLTIIMVSHDPAYSSRGDKIISLEDGAMV